MDVRVGEEFEIALEGNPTTGYLWTADYDGSFLSLKEDVFMPGSPGEIGGGGIHRFVFVPIKPGETRITMTYKRPWEASPLDFRISDVRIS